jgi:hypothetical protein
MPHAPIPGAPLDSLDRLRARTKMMVEDYDLSAPDGGARPTRPTFRTQFSLADASGAPAPGDKVQLWASEPLAITVDGQSFMLPTQPEGAPSFTANAMGLVSVTYSGDQIRSPFVFARTAAVPEFGTVPDYEVLNILSGVQPAGLAPDAAKGYDGMPLLDTKFQDETNRTAIASAVRNSVGRVPQNAMMSSLFLAGGSMAPFSAPPSRGVSPNDILHWSLDFGDNLDFTPSDTELITQAQAALVNFSLLGRLKEFERDVVNGVKKLTRVVTMWAEDAATFICQVAEGFYMFVVKTIDDAVNVARAIFRQVVAFAERVIEWLSFLFQWKDILNTQGAVADLVMNAFQAFRRTVDKQLANGAQDVRAFFQARERDIDQLFRQVSAQNGDTFASGTRGSASENPFAAGGQDSSVQLNWLMERAMTAAGGLTLPNATDGPWNRIESFAQAARAQLAANPQTQDLEKRVGDVVDRLGSLIRSFPNFGALGASDLLGVFGDLAVITMEAADLVIEGLLELLRNLVDEIVTLLTQPIPIPFVSELFKALTKRELTFVELGAFLIAVPTTILYKALFGRAPVDAAATEFAALGAPTWGPLALALALFVKSGVEPIFDGLLFAGIPSTIAGGVNLAVTVAIWGLKAALALVAAPGNVLSLEDGLILSLGLFPIFVGTGFVLGTPATRLAAAPVVPGFLTAYGLLLAILHSALAGLALAGVADLQKYSKNYLANLTGDLPAASKALSFTGVPGRGLVLLLDFVGNLSSGLFFRQQWNRGAASLVTA